MALCFPVVEPKGQRSLSPKLSGTDKNETERLLTHDYYKRPSDEHSSHHGFS